MKSVTANQSALTEGKGVKGRRGEGGMGVARGSSTERETI